MSSTMAPVVVPRNLTQLVRFIHVGMRLRRIPKHPGRDPEPTLDLEVTRVQKNAFVVLMPPSETASGHPSWHRYGKAGEYVFDETGFEWSMPAGQYSPARHVRYEYL